MYSPKNKNVGFCKDDDDSGGEGKGVLGSEREIDNDKTSMIESLASSSKRI